MPRPVKVKKTTATVTLTLVQIITLDVEALVENYGPAARTKAFLIDYAIGNRDCRVPECWSGGAMVESSTCEFEKETVNEFER